MSEQDVALKVAEILKVPIREAAGEAADLRMKELPGIVQKEMEGLPELVRKEMDACIGGHCKTIAEAVLEKLPKAEASTFKVEDVTKSVMAALAEGGKTAFNVEGHTAHDILDCPTCKPLIVDKLWASDEYKQNVMEKICEDDACRDSMTKMFTEKGIGVEKDVGTETWSERRLRERRERAGK